MAEGLRLRYRRKAALFIVWTTVGSLVVTVLFSIEYAWSHHEDLRTEVWIWLVIWGFGMAAVLPRWTTRYWIRTGETLVARGLNSGRVHLPSVWRARVEHNARGRILVLVLNMTRIYLGEARMPCYYEPTSLYSLANGLDQSLNPEVRGIAAALRELADDPRRSSWPPPSKLTPTSE